ncbi:MAG: NAD(P)-dependent alcohol dehydrogenase [Bacteroidia bacterium]|nr:NAD(P)-dependent alcohol dehydrogenase [Bacteroidia bacterium]
MRAIVCTRYGPPEVLELRDVPQPVAKPDQVLIKIHASSLTAGDCEMRRFQIHPLFWLPLRLAMGIRKPRVGILGQEFSGEIVSVGAKVNEYKPGDQVFGCTDFHLSAHAEYKCLKASYPFARRPAWLSHNEAATACVGGLNAICFIRKANLKPGESILINGAGGSIGTFAVQLAKLAGATVTAVDRGEKLTMLREIGADFVIDYQRDDFSKQDNRYDVILDISGKSSYTKCIRSLNERGRYVLTNMELMYRIRGLFAGSKQVILGLAPYLREDYAYLIQLLESKQVKIVIDKVFSLEQMVEAHRYVETGRKAGNVAIEI